MSLSRSNVPCEELQSFRADTLAGSREPVKGVLQPDTVGAKLSPGAINLGFKSLRRGTTRNPSNGDKMCGLQCLS
jgi:hypothetical protein